MAKKDEFEKEEKQKEKDIKENLQQNYLDNAKDIYRCIYCSRIPIININEHEHNISINCSCEKNNNYSSICNKRTIIIVAYAIIHTSLKKV